MCSAASLLSMPFCHMIFETGTVGRNWNMHLNNWDNEVTPEFIETQTPSWQSVATCLKRAITDCTSKVGMSRKRTARTASDDPDMFDVDSETTEFHARSNNAAAQKDQEDVALDDYGVDGFFENELADEQMDPFDEADGGNSNFDLSF